MMAEISLSELSKNRGPLLGMAMGGTLIRTIGLIRARAKIGLENLSYNFQRFLHLSPPGRSQLA